MAIDILIVDGAISEIGPGGSLEAPAGALRIEGRGLTAVPGLIDMHIHLKGGWTGGNALPDKYAAGRTDPELQQTLSAFLYSGVTTVLDVGNPTVWAATQRDRIERGELLGPRFFTTGMPFSQDPSGWDGAVRAETVGEPDPAELSTKVVSPDPDELSKSLDIYVDNDIEIFHRRRATFACLREASGDSCGNSSWMSARLGAATVQIRRDIPNRRAKAKKRGSSKTLSAVCRVVPAMATLNHERLPSRTGDAMKMTGLDGWAQHLFAVRMSALGATFLLREAKSGGANKWTRMKMRTNDRIRHRFTANVGEKMSGLRVKDDGDNQSFFKNPLIVDIWGQEVVPTSTRAIPMCGKTSMKGLIPSTRSITLATSRASATRF